MGSLTFLVLYMASGIFGSVVNSSDVHDSRSFYSNVLGGNFALVGSPSVGASGAIFGTTAVGIGFNAQESGADQAYSRLRG